MLVVSCRLLAWRRLISSWMLTSDSEVTCFSSSIFASSSAMGCSKSRKATAMYGIPGTVQAGARGYGSGALPSIREGSADTTRRSAIDDLHAATSDESLELLQQL